MVKVIAIQGYSNFLIQTKENKGRILDLDRNEFFPEFLIQSIIARGYWENWQGSQKILKDIFKRAKIKKEEISEIENISDNIIDGNKYIVLKVLNDSKYRSLFSELFEKLSTFSFSSELSIGDEYFYMGEISRDEYSKLKGIIDKYDNINLEY